MAAALTTPRAVYLAAGANRQSAAADWSDNGTLCFGAGINLAVWRPTDTAAPGILALCRGHRETIKAVRFLPDPVSGDRDRDVGNTTSTSSRYLVTGSDDGVLRVWTVRGAVYGTGDKPACVCVAVREEAHPAAAVNCIAAPLSRTISSQEAPRLFATGGSDATIRLWTLQSSSDDPATVAIVPVQTIHTKPRFFPLSLALVELDGLQDAAVASPSPSPWLLAAAGTSSRIHVFVGRASSTMAIPTFNHKATLAGHEDWVRALDIARERYGDPESDLLLASASQDKYVRLWRIRRRARVATSRRQASLQTEAETPSNKTYHLPLGAQEGDADADEAAITFEALLLGHEDWVYSARWDQGRRRQQQQNRGPRLLTASADNSLALWAADTASGLWVTTARLGELSKEKGATSATGSMGGFWTGLWAPGDGTSVVTLCRTGSWRLWTAASRADDAEEGDVVKDDDDDNVRWTQAVGITGHVAAVTGVAWSRGGYGDDIGSRGAYLLSTSSDQTTRLHAAWQRYQPAAQPAMSWHELARPQIHGYDLNCIDTLGPRQFVSGADEKLLRVFDEPKTAARLRAWLTGGVDDSGNVDADTFDVLPDAAHMPVLGLSNKAVDGVEENDDNHGSLDAPPPEDVLARGTLWPETEKLYGHGYEISALSASHDGRFVASACRASALQHAVVRLMSTAPRWISLQPPLAAHTLTVTRLRFSTDNRFLLSVGRDRQWALYERAVDADMDNTDQDANPYRVRQIFARAHARMLLDAAWAPSDTATSSPSIPVFATASRDKTVKIWRLQAAAVDAADATNAPDVDAAFVLAVALPQDQPVTAIDILARPSPSLVLAIGSEAGQLSIVTLDRASLHVLGTLVVDPALCLPKAVLQLAWRPPSTDQDADVPGATDIAIAGDDASLRVYRIAGL